MADIQLGIDVDSRDVVTADVQMDKLTGSFRQLEQQSQRTTAATQRAERAWRGQSDAMRLTEQRAAAAAAQMQKMQVAIAGVNTAVTAATRLFILFAGSQVIRGIVNAADSYSMLQARIRLVTGDQKVANAVMEQLNGIAERTQSRVGAVADTWLRMAPALQATGKSLQNAIDFTEALNSALVISGSTGSEAAAVQLQLAQAMASGVLRGDELNSVMEQGAKVTRLIAEEMGVTVGQLRGLAEQGLITSDIIDRALRGNLEALRAEAAEMPRTVGGAFGALADSVQRLVGEVNEATGATGKLSQAILATASVIDTLTARFDESAAAGVAWAANVDAASRTVAISTARNISVAITALEDLRRAQASVTPLEGDSPFTLAPGTNRVGNAISETEKLIRLEKQRLEGQRDRAETATVEHAATKGVAEFTDRINAALNATVPAATGVATALGGRAAGGGGRASGGAAGAARELSEESKLINDEIQKMVQQTAELDRGWQSVSASIADSLRQMASGDLVGGGTGFVNSIADALWGDQMQDAFRKASDTLVKGLRRVLGGGAEAGGALAGSTWAMAGMGISTAIIGGLNQNAQQVGSGLGSAIGGVAGSMIGKSIGGAIGAFAGPVGMVLGSIAGGFISNLFGGGEESPWKRVSGEAFTGTTYATSVMTSSNVNTDNNEFLGERFAFQGVRALLADFNDELVQFVEAMGGTVERGTKLIVDETAALEAITGALDERKANRPGETREEAAERIAKTVAEIMGIAAAIVQEAGPPLTEAQKLWRETQERFSEQNVAILKELGFSARQISETQQKVLSDIKEGFEEGLLQGLVDSGHATRSEIDKWLQFQLASLEEQRRQGMATAREIGASTDLVRAAFRADRRNLMAEYRDLLNAMVEETAQAVTRIERLQFGAGAATELAGLQGTPGNINRAYRLNVALVQEQRREAVAEARRLGVDVNLVHRLYNARLIQLTKDRNQALLDIHERGLERQAAALDRFIGRLETSIGRLQDRLSNMEQMRADTIGELTQRMEDARRAEQTLADARAGLAGGDLNPGGPMARFRALQAQFNTAIRTRDADSAAGLASELLTAGRGVFASGSGYVDLFRTVNAQLLGLQRSFGAGADTIERTLDAETFTELTERSTKALLLALGRLNDGIADVKDEIADQTKELRLARQKQNVAKGAA